MGVTMALPLRSDGAGGPRFAATAATKLHWCASRWYGAAGSTQIGIKKNLWALSGVGRDFDLSATSLKSLEPFKTT